MQNVTSLVGTARKNALVDCFGNLVGSWNGKNVRSLYRTMEKLSKRIDLSFCVDDIPHQDQIPNDIKEICKGYETCVCVWACDVRSNCIVTIEDGGSFLYMHANEVRIYLATSFGFDLRLAA